MQPDGKLASPLDLKSGTPKRLTLATPAPGQKEAQRRDKYRGAALGMVSTESFPAVVGTADAMLKAADVLLVGYEKTGGGHCTAIVRGGISDVRMAVEAGIKTAQDFGQFVSSTLIPRPLPNLEAVLPICARWDELRRDSGGRMSSQAIGLLETRGFPAMVGAADAMTKSADVQLMSHETIGEGLCTILIRGSLPNVAIAIEAGMHEAERIGELHAVMVIPRPLDDLVESLPVMEMEQEQKQPEPLRIPLNLEVKQEETEAEPVLIEAAAEEATPIALELTVDEQELADEEL
ncbi:BMC domain-containing protein [Phormidium tenue]|uniref:Carbon dioxide concentrating mechanism/carboxysome shell protein n=1 Tax=Phormidium tenue NIES-30 TaxID=549789 RepID=A0A1U7J5I3_9CYAN|nr:BMC domain-containing protein [Phormidium tenue FACHB-1052]OKH48057.1 carbon dioxide concentrating mechanism/carboxysome shell protein [Phormidium tenue NIES-30]